MSNLASIKATTAAMVSATQIHFFVTHAMMPQARTLKRDCGFQTATEPNTRVSRPRHLSHQMLKYGVAADTVLGLRKIGWSSN